MYLDLGNENAQFRDAAAVIKGCAIFAMHLACGRRVKPRLLHRAAPNIIRFSNTISLLVIFSPTHY